MPPPLLLPLRARRRVRRRTLPLLLLLVLLPLACRPTAPPFPTTPVLPAADRPGLLLDAADLPLLRARITRAPYAAWWGTVRALAEQAANGSPGSAGLSEETRARWAKAAAFAFVLDGDPRHRDAAALALGAVGTGPNAPLDDLGPNLGASSRTVLTASSHLQAACVAYDLVRHALTPAERTLAETRLAAAAEEMHGQQSVDPGNTARVNNWRTKAGAALATAGLALPADVRGPAGTGPADWLARGLAAIAQVLPVVVRDGWNREGAWYTTYSLGNLLPFAIHYRRASGQDVFPWLEPLFAHALLLRQPNGRQPALEDSPEADLPWGVAAPFLSDPAVYHGAWLQAGSSSTNFDNNDVKQVEQIVFVDDGIAATTPPFASVLDGANRIARLAAGDDVQVIVNGAADFENYFLGGGHAHTDPLGLVAFAQGESLLVDGGYGPNGFSSLNRGYYLLAEAHNVLSYDGKAAFLTEPATLRAFLAADAAGSLISLETDYPTILSPAPQVAAHATRTALLAGRRALYVADEIARDTPAVLAAHWHGRGTRTVVAETADRAEVEWTRERPGAADTRLRVVSTASTPVTVARASGFYSGLWGEEEAVDYVRFEAAGVTALRMLSVLDLGGPADPPLVVTHPPCAGGECLDVRDGAARDTLLLGDGSTPLVSEGLEAHARFVRVRREGGELTLAQMEAGTRLGLDGATVLSAERPATLSLERKPGADTLVVSAPLAEPLAISVAGHGAATTSVTWSGYLRLPFEVGAGGEVRFSVPHAGSVRIER